MNTIILCSYDEKLLPQKQSIGAVCRDIRVAKKIVLKSRTCCQVKTWLKIYSPPGWCTKIYARSGLPIKKWLMLANGTAIIDSDYRWECIVLLYNFIQSDMLLEKYTRVAQIEFCPYYIESKRYGYQDTPELIQICDQEIYKSFDKQYPSERGKGKFHSTGSN